MLYYRRMRRLNVELASALVIYGMVMFGTIWLIRNHVIIDLTQRRLLAFVPLVGSIAIALATLRSLRRLDELQRRILSEGFIFAFVVSAAVTFSYGWLQNMAEAPALTYNWVMVILCFSWALGTVIARTRYR